MGKGKGKEKWASEEVLGDTDLLGEILVRLPAKLLVGFKCVCKQWFSLISNPEFCRNHVLRHQSSHFVPCALLFSACYVPSPPFEVAPLRNHSSTFKVPNFDYLSDPSTVTILRSCNGLLLCQIFCKRSRPKQVFRYSVCNPTTKQFARIPSPNDKVLSLYLAFEPLKSPNYKVISLWKLADKLGIDIYSSVTGFWSDPEISFTPPLKMAISTGVFFKGAIHWYSDDHYSIYFDVDSQCLKTMPMPPKEHNQDHLGIRYFGESRGHLHIVLLDMVGAKYNIVEMEDDHSGWLVKYHLTFYDIGRANPDLVRDCFFWPLSIIQDEKEEDLMIVMFLCGTVMSYNLKHQTVKELKHLESYRNMAILNFIKGYPSSEQQHGLGVFQYFESLSSV